MSAKSTGSITRSATESATISEDEESSYDCSSDNEEATVDKSSSSKYRDEFDSDDDDQSDREELSMATLTRLSRLGELNRVHNNKTFTADRVREIEKNNLLLMDKILTYNNKRKPFVPQRKEFSKPRMTSHEINRRKSQHKIDRENQILLRKIKSVKPSIKH